MSTTLSAGAVVAGTVLSLATSWVLVSRLERLGERFGFSEALLGILAALSANAPEITSAFTAVLHDQRSIGIGVILGSNVFNLAALLGLGALVAGHIRLHRKVVLFGGTVAIAIAALAVLVVVGALAPGVGLGASLAVLVPYTVVAASPRWLRNPAVLARPAGWLLEAVHEEEQELAGAIDTARGTGKDAIVATVALVVVVAASVVMERGASHLGRHFGIPDIVLGAVLLAAATSIPNAVAAIHLARRGRGSAVLSEALNSNTLNVVIGLLLPATVIGLAAPSPGSTLVAVWVAVLTAIALVLAYRHRGVTAAAGGLIIVAYLALVGLLTGVVA